MREVALLAATSVAALGVLALLDMQIFTEPWSIDPWLYTALMSNFDFTYEWFGTTYYASRLPAILPGVFLNSFLTPVQSYVVLHLVFFLTAAAFLYLLVRTLFGIRIATLLYPVFLTNAIFIDAHTWDYVDGFVITYLCGGLYFLASSLGGTSRVRPALAGFFLAAAVTTNLFAVLLAGGAVLAYLAVRATADRRLGPERIGLDALWFSAGAVVLVSLCGLFAEANGGRFLFFMPSIDALETLSTAPWKLPSYEWMRGEPRLLVPLVLGAAVALTWGRRRPADRPALGLALSAAGVAIYLVLVYWEFFQSGTFLQLEYYFDMVYPFVFVALGATVFAFLARSNRELSAPPALLALIGLAVGAAPLVAIYGLDRGDLSGRQGAVVAAVLMGALIALALVLRLGTARALTPAVAAVACVLAILSVNYASAANATTRGKLEADETALAQADEVFSIGVQLMDFMERNGLHEGSLPAFWYDQSSDGALVSIQSLYYYGFTLVSLELPIPDPELRARLEALKTTSVVVLCARPECGGGAQLRRAGYTITLVGARRLHAGPKSVWVQAYRLELGG